MALLEHMPVCLRPPQTSVLPGVLLGVSVPHRPRPQPWTLAAPLSQTDVNSGVVSTRPFPLFQLCAPAPCVCKEATRCPADVPLWPYTVFPLLSRPEHVSALTRVCPCAFPTGLCGVAGLGGKGEGIAPEKEQEVFGTSSCPTHSLASLPPPGSVTGVSAAQLSAQDWEVDAFGVFFPTTYKLFPDAFWELRLGLCCRQKERERTPLSERTCLPPGGLKAFGWRPSVGTLSAFMGPSLYSWGQSHASGRVLAEPVSCCHVVGPQGVLSDLLPHACACAYTHTHTPSGPSPSPPPPSPRGLVPGLPLPSSLVLGPCALGTTRNTDVAPSLPLFVAFEAQCP